MAKNIHPLIRLQGSFQGIVFVKSRSYGDHIRAARGSKKKVNVNEVLHGHATRTAILNNTAKRLHDPLKLFAGSFKESFFWQRLLGCMRKSASNDFDQLLLSAKGLEINSRYPLKRFGKPPDAGLSRSVRKIQFTLTFSETPFFKADANCYFYEALILFFSDSPQQDASIVMRTQWIDITEGPQPFSVEGSKPKGAKYFLVCLKLQWGNNEIAKTDFGSMGMMIAAAGML